MDKVAVGRLSFAERKVEAQLVCKATFELCYCASGECDSHLAIECLRLGCNCSVYGCTREIAGMLLSPNAFLSYDSAFDFGSREYEKLVRRREAVVRGSSEVVVV